MPLNINLLPDEVIARGVTTPDFIGGFTGYQAGQDYAQKQQERNLFANGLPRAPDGSIDYGKAAEMVLQAQGVGGLTGALAAQKFNLLQNYFKNANTMDVPNPGFPPQATPGPQSSLTDQERPVLPPSIQGSGLAAAKTYDTPRNVGEVTGVDRGPVEGNPALFQPTSATAFQQPPATLAERFNAATDANVEDPNLPSNARPQEMQVAENTQRQPTRIFIPGPNPEGEQTQQSPTGDLGGVPGQQRTSGGLEFSEANAQRFERAAAQLYQRSEALAALDPAMGAAARARADSYSATAKQIRDALGKNIEMTPDEKAARSAGVPILEMKRREEAGKLDVKDFQESMTSINNAAQNAVTGLQKAQLGKQLTQQPDFYSGPLNEYATQFRQFQNIFGINPAGAAPNEIFQKVTNDMLQEQIKAMGQSGVGRVLMSEVAVMQRALASLGITDVSNRALMEMTARTYRKAQELAEITANMPPNSQKLRQAVLGYLKTHPMFSDEERANPGLLGSKEPPPQAAQWNRQQVMQWGAQNGLRPGDPFMFNGQLRAIPRGP